MKIVWRVEPPTEVRAAVDRLVHLFPLPLWCNTLYLEWNDSSLEFFCEIDIIEEHRWGTLTIYPSFISLPEDERMRTIAHEFAHAYLARIDNAWEDVLECVPNNVKKLAEKIYERACEAAVEDIAATWLSKARRR